MGEINIVTEDELVLEATMMMHQQGGGAFALDDSCVPLAYLRRGTRRRRLEDWR